MASKLAMQGSLRRTKTSQQSLSSLSPDSSSLSPAGKSMVLRLEKLSTSSSLYLHGVSGSLSSFPSAKPLFQRQASTLSSSTFSVDSSIVCEPPVLDNPSNLIQWGVLVALAFQIPKLLDEIHLIIDLHYHSFPLLVVLGTFPSFLKRKRDGRNSKDSNTFSSESEGGLSFESSWLLRRESSTKLDFQSEFVPLASSDSAGGDEWGHFMDLDGSTLVIEQDVKLATPPSSRIILTTLEEEEEEE